jgi:hypothetical protein
MLLVKVHIETLRPLSCCDDQDAFPAASVLPLDIPRTEVAVRLVPSAVGPRQVAGRQAPAGH